MLPPIVVTPPKAAQQSQISGFGDLPLRQVPLSATVIDSADIRASGAQRLADLYKFDASVSDAYNSIGYIDYATVRGFVINNKSNYRRDGLPISGDTAIHLGNKDRVEILKGTSGMQAGISAPGGLVNYVIKRPGSKEVRELDVSVNSQGQFGAALDMAGRFGQDQAQGYRLNLAADRLNSPAPGTRGSRSLAALALQSRVGAHGLLEAEMELSRQSQPNIPGVSLLGSAGQPAAQPKLNLNAQTWSLPSVFEGSSGSLRYEHALSERWRASAHVGTQRLTTDDRNAFPFGCGAEGVYDRFCSNGDVDIYDYRSEGERRRSTAAQLNLQGEVTWGHTQHALSLALLQSSGRTALPDYAYNYVGTLNLAAPTQALSESPAPIAGSGNLQREKSTEFSATDVISWSPAFKTWLGLRHSQIQRSDALSSTRYRQSFTTPWLAASYALGDATLYASHGHGIESDVVPTLGTANPGQVLPVRRSRQTEIGLKSSGSQAFSWQAAAFQIERPMSNVDACGFVGSTDCWVVPDGYAVHTGLELGAGYAQAAWQISGSATLLRARRQGSQTAPALNGLAPTNVPSHILRLNAAYRIKPAVLLGAHLSHEGRRAVLPDNSLSLPAWTRLDASLAWEQRALGLPSTLRVSINNLLGKRYFQESPYQFSHAYLFPAAPRTLRVSLSMAL